MNSQQMIMQQQMDRDIYVPGTRLTVGSHQVVIDKYFSKGGFAQVYTCNISPPWNGRTLVCLKRVMVPDKGSLGILRKEVDAMRKLQGINCIVSYIDSHATRSHGGNGPGYEVFMLMEYCSGKGLIDFMNTRLVEKLKESEILTIMQQITEAVAHMHSLSPPLIHRDIKIENILIGDDGTFKLCDFGSVCNPIMPPKNIEEFQIVQDDIMKNTTPQYRSPEMLDLYKNQPIDGKADVWALGILLYKLCYFTTPFEQNAINGNQNGYSGDYAIINGIYSIPSQPPYSARLKNIIAKLLVVDPARRPNVFVLLDELYKMKGQPTPVIKKTAPITMSLPTTPLNQQPNQYMKSALPLTNSVTAFNNMVNSVNTGSSSIATSKPISAASSINSTVTGVVSTLSGKSQNSYASAPAFKYSSLHKSITNTVEDKLTENDGKASITKKFTDIQLSPPKTRSAHNRRPVSQYGHVDLNRKNGSSSNRESDGLDIKNFMNDISTEETVKLSPSNGKSQNSISSSIDYIKSLSRQNTSNQNAQHTGSRNASRSKKRNSITSLKNLLTGGSIKGTSAGNNEHLTERSNSRKSSSLYAAKRNSSIDSLSDAQQKYKSLNSTLADLKEMSPEGKMPARFSDTNNMELPKIKNLTDNLPEVAYTPSNDVGTNGNVIPSGIKRSNSIQSRVKNFLRSTSPPTTKTAHGYGKYTEEDVRLSSPSSVQLSSSSSKSHRSARSQPNSEPKSGEEAPPKPARPGVRSEKPLPLIPNLRSPTKKVSPLPPRTEAASKSSTFKTTSTMKEKRKPPPPPRPKKPAHLKLSSGHITSKVGTGAGMDDSFEADDLDALEKRFERKFPGVV